ncbi:MAG: c-type cytochrome biogenesis protein CcmI [Pseudomonadota bacterium]
MFEFLTATGILAALAALAIIRPLTAGRQGDVSENRDAADAALYRDQLAELDRDLERGMISPSESEGAKAEIARRLIASAKRAEAAGAGAVAPQKLTRQVTIGALIGAPILGALVYVAIGSPGYENRPLLSRDFAAETRAARLPQAEAEAMARASDTQGPRRAAGTDDYAALVARLETVVESRPDDIEGHRLLSSALLRQQRFVDAWPVIARLIELEGANADATLYATQAEAMIRAAGGYVSPEAEAALSQALALDPALPEARYFAGHALAQIGQPNEALAIWQRLALEADPEAPWLPSLRQAIADVQASTMADLGAGQPGAAPFPAGVDPEAAAAVAAMSPEERMAFMEARTEALEERLVDEGGTPDEWAQLLRAYSTLGRTEDALRAYGLSQELLTGSEAGFLREQALVLGIINE